MAETAQEFRNRVDAITTDASTLIESGDALTCPFCETLLVYSPYAWEHLTSVGIDCDTVSGSCFETRCGRCGVSWHDEPETNPLMAESSNVAGGWPVSNDPSLLTDTWVFTG